MKKTLFLLSIFISLIFISGSTISQWSNPVSLSTSSANYTGLTTNSARSIVTSGNSIFAVWTDSRWWTSGDIYFRRSTNSGLSWLAEVVLTNNQPESINPSIAIYGSTLHVVWEEYRDGNAEIYYKRSTNEGATWSADVRLTNAVGFSEFPGISASANGVHVAWRESRDGNSEEYYKRSTNGGLTWGADTRLTNNTSSSGYPSIVTNGMGVHIAWKDYRNGNDEIYYKSSTDNGLTWSADTRITNNTAVTGDPCIATSGLNLYLTFIDNRNSHYHVYLKKSTNLGATWSNEIQVTNLYYDNHMPSIAIGNNGNNIHIAYYHSNSPNFYDVFYTRSTNGGANWGSVERITQFFYGSHPQVALTGNTVHIIHRWRTDNFFDIWYWRNTTGNPTAINNTGTEIPSEYSLSQNYPNPFNPSTNINFSVPVKGMVKLAIYDISGKQLDFLVNEQLSAGTYKVDWSAGKYSSGVYLYKLETEGFTETKKMMLIK